ncbi:MAG: UDP-N-acetylglucosamine 1-carboxyvinyltransferase [Anaerolineae bacterium]|nr:UDP-N-acetylglucosamine 1-carboxyvinyltransferase [Anaerolineae bacterium]
MDKFIIEGGRPLNGSVTPSGNKNAALPLLAAALLTDEPLILQNVPDIRDVRTMAELLGQLGVQVHDRGDHTLELRAERVQPAALDPDRCREIRASILLAGPMLARAGQIELPPPGGDVIGRRRLDTHFWAFQNMGAQVEIDTRLSLRARSLTGSDMLLDEMSVTATENALMAAVLAKGTTVIRNAASEPHVQDLALCLNQMGARISGIGTNVLVIEGVDRLHGTEFRISPDYIEIGSWIGLGAITFGELRIRGVAPDQLRMIRLMFEQRLGVRMRLEGADLIVPSGQRLQVHDDADGAAPKIEDMPWPGFPADLMSIALVVATQTTGTILIHEKMFESRLFFVDRLIDMGARIVLCDPHRAVVIGPNRLRADPTGIPSPDIRAGMALLLAALVAEGRTVIRNIRQIDRGYERLDEKLLGLGASIQRVAEG